ncbi:DNA-binding response OmpR family regulator [Scopulibacillus darangshiensis]|uniref:DNA-binding response OmpR family regulator n=1 Tax=Scopulibacillus darangshiensis TaxID=442528 RepID=A0A4R2NST0_9BACL|nr:DNA-binding response OmpR family regulator [Scopulibacillus darangshiensis]
MGGAKLNPLSILLVEDEENVAQFIELELRHEGYDVTRADDGEAALEFFREGNWDLLLLDWMLPKLDGLEVCRRIRKKSNTPIIILTARGHIGDKIAGLDTGADDYITKPFEIEELLARIRAVTRRNNLNSNPQKGETLQIADLEMDKSRRLVKRNSTVIDLTPREFNLLQFLMEHEGKVLDREWLLSAVWGYDFIGETNVVDVYIRYLRNKLDRNYTPKLIQTVRGVGYVLRPSD